MQLMTYVMRVTIQLARALSTM